MFEQENGFRKELCRDRFMSHNLQNYNERKFKNRVLTRCCVCISSSFNKAYRSAFPIVFGLPERYLSLMSKFARLKQYTQDKEKKKQSFPQM